MNGTGWEIHGTQRNTRCDHVDGGISIPRKEYEYDILLAWVTESPGAYYKQVKDRELSSCHRKGYKPGMSPEKRVSRCQLHSTAWRDPGNVEKLMIDFPSPILVEARGILS